jgi:GGDEF domain-containing protein
MDIACFPKDGHVVYALVKAADKALYQAKAKQRLVTTLDIEANKDKKVL